MAEHGETVVMGWSPQQALDHYAALARKRRRDDRTDYILTRNAITGKEGAQAFKSMRLKGLNRIKSPPKLRFLKNLCDCVIRRRLNKNNCFIFERKYLKPIEL